MSEEEDGTITAIESPKARYQQVADLLRAEILRGTYPSGELPSQPDLAKRYGLHQTTINRAISVLRNEGLVRVEKGKGAYVQEVPTVKRVRRIPGGGGKGGSFASEMRRFGLEPDTPLVELATIPAPDDIAEYLHLAENEQVVMRKRHMLASGKPMQLATSYLPISIVGDQSIAVPDVGPTELYKRLAGRGYRPARFVEEIEVRRPTIEEAEFLKLSEGQPVLSVVRVAFTMSGTPVDAVVNVLAGHQWRLAYEWENPAND